MLQVHGLNVFRGRTRVLHNVDLFVEPGEIVTLIGANGAGKTSLLMALSGLLPIHSGSARYITGNGETFDVTHAKPESLVGAGLVHCPEGRQIFARLTIEENLRLGAFLNRDTRRIATLMDEVFDLFPVLGERRALGAGGLSGGEQMMLAVGRALMAEPRMLLLDEPSLGLSPRNTETIFEMLGQLHSDRRVTILLVEQNAMLALEIATRGYVLQDGKIVHHGPSHDLTKDPTVQEAYLGLTR